MTTSNFAKECEALRAMLIEHDRKQNDMMKSAFRQLETKMNQINHEIKDLNYKRRIIDRQSRRNNVLLYKLIVPSGVQNITSFVLEKLNSIVGTNLQMQDINQCFFLGNGGDHPRPIMLKFASYIKKSSLFSKGAVVKLRTRGVSIVNDLCPEDRQDQQKLRKHLRVARSRNLFSRIAGRKLLIENRFYTLEELDRMVDNEQSVDQNNDTDEESSVADGEGSPLNGFEIVDTRTVKNEDTEKKDNDSVCSSTRGQKRKAQVEETNTKRALNS